MTKFSANPYFIYFSTFRVFTLTIKELIYINKINFFYFYFKKYHNLHNFNRNLYIIRNIIEITNIIKQHYGIIKTFKVLVFVKKKQFSRTNILIIY